MKDAAELIGNKYPRRLGLSLFMTTYAAITLAPAWIIPSWTPRVSS